ncbi:MAG: hypothetical protein JWM36_1673 [Hyphomicrobiales bacterium]|nr:hypothetical protein [Hyphomicrobiales bacterium]
MPQAFLLLSGAVLAASLFCGGGTPRGLLSDLPPELLAVPLLLWASQRATMHWRDHRLLLSGAAALLLIPVLQLVPLPPAVWAHLPGRAPFFEGYLLAGIAPPWLPVTLTPGAAWRSLFALLPGLALFCAMLSLDLSARKKLAGLALAIGVVSIPMGMLQILGGATSPFDLFAGAGASQGRATGFFANPNHFASFLALLVPLAAALWRPAPASAGQRPSALTLVGGLALIFGLLLGLTLTGSRSVLILGALALLASFGLIWRQPLQILLSRRAAWLVAVAGLLAAAPLALGMGLATILGRVATVDVAEDARWTVALGSWTALKPYWPVGAGVGAFDAIYQRHETGALMLAQFVNHAHNDWLEIVLEAGVPGVVGLGLWLAFLTLATVRLTRSGGDRTDALAAAALIGLWLLSLHSLWDYPLRTVALSACFGLLAGLTRPAPVHAPPPRHGRRAGSDRTPRRSDASASRRPAEPA